MIPFRFYLMFIIYHCLIVDISKPFIKQAFYSMPFILYNVETIKINRHCIPPLFNKYHLIVLHYCDLIIHSINDACSTRACDKKNLHFELWLTKDFLSKGVSIRLKQCINTFRIVYYFALVWRLNGPNFQRTSFVWIKFISKDNNDKTRLIKYIWHYSNWIERKNKTQNAKSLLLPTMEFRTQSFCLLHFRFHLNDSVLSLSVDFSIKFDSEKFASINLNSHFHRCSSIQSISLSRSRNAITINCPNFDTAPR